MLGRHTATRGDRFYDRKNRRGGLGNGWCCRDWHGRHRLRVLEAIVTDCATQVPVSGVKATLKLDRGVGEPDRTADTGPDGRLRILMNEPLSAWATLTLEKAGYRSWTRQFQGTPSERPVRICLQKLPAREASVKGER